ASRSVPVPTLPLHDALPIWLILRRQKSSGAHGWQQRLDIPARVGANGKQRFGDDLALIGLHPAVTLLFERGTGNGTLKPAKDKRSEEHTSELQSRENLVCRL